MKQKNPNTVKTVNMAVALEPDTVRRIDEYRDLILRVTGDRPTRCATLRMAVNFLLSKKGEE